MTTDRFLRARWSTRCPNCNEIIQIGDAITLERSPKARHYACSIPKAPTPAVTPSKWAQYKARVVTIKRGSRTVSGKLFHETRYHRQTGAPTDRWFLAIGYSGYEGSTYWKSFDLQESDTVVSVEAA